MAGNDPNDEWLGYVQPVGLVVAPVVLARYGLTPAIQTKADTDAMRAFIAPKLEDGKAKGADRRALADPWAFFVGTLGWRPAQVAGAPGGPPVPEDLFLKVEESDTEIGPDWAVRDPDGGWQALARIEPEGVKAEERGALAGWEATAQQRFERLLREKQIPLGIQITDEELRLIHAPRGETSGWLTFPLRSLAEVGGRPMLGGLKLLLSSFRLHNDAPEKRLPGLVKASREARPKSPPGSPRRCWARCMSFCAASTPPTGSGSKGSRATRPSISTTGCSSFCSGSCSCSTPRTAI